MARSLYRIFLYLVVHVMLTFAAISLGSLLTTLLALTSLRGPSDPPTSAQLVQSTVLASVGVVFFVALGGLFYWLIRRDIKQDPGAARGGVRAFFLNFAQGIAALFALFAGVSVFQGLGQYYAVDVTGPLAALLVAAGVFVLEQLERRRGDPAPGAPIVLQRLHFYAVQVIVLIAAMSIWSNAITTTVQLVAGQYNAYAPYACQPASYAPAGPPGCSQTSLLLGLWLAVLWTAVVWVAYFLLARRDSHSVLRVIAQFAGFVIGLIGVLMGVERAVELGLRFAFGLESSFLPALATSYDFLSPLLFGAVVLAGYGIWLERDSAKNPLGEIGTELTTLAVTGITLGFAFYIAVVALLYQLGEAAFAGAAISTATLAANLALLFTGLAHPLIALELRRRSTLNAPIGPRRAFVLAGLAAGALAAFIAGAIALYFVISALLGSPVGDNWPANARLATEVLLVGAFITGIHLWRAVVEHSFAAQHGAAAPVSGSSDSVDGILDELLAGKITRDQAASRLKGLVHDTDH
jgi:hypothetical protein